MVCNLHLCVSVRLLLRMHACVPACLPICVCACVCVCARVHIMMRADLQIYINIIYINKYLCLLFQQINFMSRFLFSYV